MEAINGTSTLYAKTRNQWRKWLAKNHEKENNIWLMIFHKNSKTPGVSYEQAVEEALCFGWIDSRPRKRDHESFYLFFSKRKPKSVWSKLNKERVSKLWEAGKMMPAGIKMVELAKETGTWKILEDIDALVIPPDLKKEFSKNKRALANFNAFPPSSKKIILTWIKSAKTPATREKRVAETVVLAAKNLRANHYIRKEG